MTLTVISLQDLLDNQPEDIIIKQVLKTFHTLPNISNGNVSDVEHFLHNKSIQFQKMGLAATHLVFSNYQNKQVLVGYFSLANKPISLKKSIFKKLSNSQKKRFKNLGFTLGDIDQTYIVPANLVGQIGKNYNKKALQTKSISGDILLHLAEEKLEEVMLIVNGKYVWLECEPNDKLREFYARNGYQEVENYISSNGLLLFIKRLR